MSDYLIYYIESNVVCIILFGIMLARDLFNVDRQEKQIKFDHALIAFMMYFFFDCIWSAVVDGVIPRTRVSVVIMNFIIYLNNVFIVYMWLRYVMAVENSPHRDRLINKFAVAFPFIISTIVMIILYFVAPTTLISSTNEVKFGYTIFLSIVPGIYIVAVLFYALRCAIGERNKLERKKHLYIGFLPVLIVMGGLFQIFFLPRTPVYCFVSTIIMMIFYIQSMEKQISIDPLTGLNNRGQLMRYIAQDSNINRENKKTFVVMIDANDFKMINDTFGHAEGDKALKNIASSLKNVVNANSTTSFLARYGGDEFVILYHPKEEKEVVELIENIRQELRVNSKQGKTQYELSVGVGYDEFLGDGDSIQKCMQRADYKLYLDKEYSKLDKKTKTPAA